MKDEIEAQNHKFFTITSEKLDQLIPALIKVQSEITPASKSCINTYYKTSYANLTDISDACRAALTKNQFAIIQTPFNDGDKAGLETIIYHASGQYYGSRLSCEYQKGNVQALGSLIQYLRRYQLAALVGVVTDDDDDAETTMNRKPSYTATAAKPQPPTAAKPKPNKIPPYTIELYRTKIEDAIDLVMLGHVKEEILKACREADDAATLGELKQAIITKSEAIKSAEAKLAPPTQPKIDDEDKLKGKK